MLSTDINIKETNCCQF